LVEVQTVADAGGERILTAPYEERDSWSMNVMRVNGTMYLEEHLTDEKLEQKWVQSLIARRDMRTLTLCPIPVYRNNMEPRQRLQTYYGYAFESYATSDTPTRQPVPRGADVSQPAEWGGDVDTNVQWCNVMKTKLGGTRMVIGGEVDCVRRA
jgi:RAT1-interacting protein